MKTKIKYILGILLLIIIIIAGYLVYKNTKSEEVPEYYTVERQTVNYVLYEKGTVISNDLRKVYPPVTGKIVEIFVTEGEKVNQDQVILKIETNWSTEEVKSPISGTIININYKVKDSILSAQQPLFEVANLESFNILLNINENEISKINTGMDSKIIIDSVSGDSFDGVVLEKSLSPVSNNLSKPEYEVLVNFNNPVEGLMIGLTAQVEILSTSSENVIAVPSEDVYLNGEKYFVKKLEWIDLDKKKFEVIEYEVEVGLEAEDFTEIKKGVEEGDLIVSPGYSEIQESQFVFER